MRAEENLFESLDKGIDEFFSQNPTEDEIKKAKEVISNLITNQDYSFANAGLKYVLARLGGVL